jgi:hypothetical protein
MPELYKFQVSANLLSLREETRSTGETIQHNSSFLVWSNRLLLAAGLRHAVMLGTPSLPSDAPEGAHILYNGFLEVLQARSLTESGDQGTPFSYRWARDWIPAIQDWSNRLLTKLYSWLLSHGFMKRVDSYLDHGVRSTLFGIGRRALRRRCRDVEPGKNNTETMDQVDGIDATEQPADPPLSPAYPTLSDVHGHDLCDCVPWCDLSDRYAAIDA